MEHSRNLGEYLENEKNYRNKSSTQIFIFPPFELWYLKAFNNLAYSHHVDEGEGAGEGGGDVAANKLNMAFINWFK